VTPPTTTHTTGGGATGANLKAPNEQGSAPSTTPGLQLPPPRPPPWRPRVSERSPAADAGTRRGGGIRRDLEEAERLGVGEEERES